MDQFAAKVTFDGLEFLVFPAARRSADGLEWWLDGIEGKATPAQWSALCEALAASVNACQPQEVVPVWPDEYVRSSDIETIARCVAFSRESLGRRETLSPDAWPAPPAEGALKHLDERQRKWVLLAWVFETLDADKVGTTAAAFEALAKQCKFVEKSYRGLRPKLGDKTGDDVPFSQKFRELRINSFIGSGWGDLLVMRDPAELVLELASAAGLTGDVSEKRVQK